MAAHARTRPVAHARTCILLTRVRVYGMLDHAPRAFIHMCILLTRVRAHSARSQFVTEFDYTLEAQLLRQAATNLMPTYGRRVVVPLPLDADHPANPLRHGRSMCTRLVLTMERLHGVSLVATQRRQLEQLAERRNTTADELREEIKRRFVSGELGGTLAPPSWLVQALDALACAQLAARNAARRVGAWATGAQYTREARAPLLNPSRVIRTLFDVHGHQLLHDGFFNGDPCATRDGARTRPTRARSVSSPRAARTAAARDALLSRARAPAVGAGTPAICCCATTGGSVSSTGDRSSASRHADCVLLAS